MNLNVTEFENITRRRKTMYNSDHKDNLKEAFPGREVGKAGVWGGLGGERQKTALE